MHVYTITHFTFYNDIYDVGCKKISLKQVQFIFEITKIHLTSTPCLHWTKSWEISQTIFDHHPYTLLTKNKNKKKTAEHSSEAKCQLIHNNWEKKNAGTCKASANSHACIYLERLQILFVILFLMHQVKKVPKERIMFTKRATEGKAE